MRRTTAILAAAVVVLAGAAPAVGAAAPAGAPPAASPAASATAPAVDARAVQSANCTFPVTVTDATGTEVTVERRPERVTTLGPSAAQTMWEIGGKPQVVGVSAQASYLADTDDLANVSSSDFGPSVEKVVGTDPDLVLAPNIISNETVANLRNAGLTVYRAHMATSIADVREKTTTLGRLTGNCAGAAGANAWMTANVEAAENATADRDRPTALYPLGGGYVANTGTFVSAMIGAAGAENALADANVSGAYPQVSAEVILDLEPEYLVLTESSSYLTGEEPYASLAAVTRNDTVRVGANYLNQPAPRSVVYAVRNLTRGFHPDADPAFVSRDEARAGAGTNATTTGSADVTATTATTDAGTTDATDGAATTATTDGTATDAAGTETTAPGFGAGVASLAVVASGLLARRRR